MTEQEQAYEEIKALFEKAFRLAKKHDLKFMAIVDSPDGKTQFTSTRCTNGEAASMIVVGFTSNAPKIAHLILASS